jgi:hypothetical protein
LKEEEPLFFEIVCFGTCALDVMIFFEIVCFGTCELDVMIFFEITNGLQVKFRQSWSKNHLPQTQLKN